MKLLYKIIKWFKSKIGTKSESKLVKFARNELNRLLNGCGDENSESYTMQKCINEDIIEIVKVFSEQEHSGCSASYALNIIKRLLDWKPIQPLTGDNNEWNDCGYCDKDGNRVFQNRRCSAVFKHMNDNTDESYITYIDKYIISDNGGITWFTSRHVLDKLGLSEIITFPFKVPENPKRIYIKYLEDIPLGETSDNFVDITDIPEEINKLRKVYDRKFHPEKYENKDDNSKIEGTVEADS